MAKRRDSITNALNTATKDQLKKFLAKEMEGNKELLERFAVVFDANQDYKME